MYSGGVRSHWLFKAPVVRQLEAGIDFECLLETRLVCLIGPSVTHSPRAPRLATLHGAIDDHVHVLTASWTRLTTQIGT